MAELRPEVAEAIGRVTCLSDTFNTYAKMRLGDWECITAELQRLTDENARLNKVESQATEQRLQMEDVELYLMEVSQPDDEDAGWCDRMKSAIEGLVLDCNEAIGQKNKSIRRAEHAEAERDALRKRIEEAPVVTFERTPTGASWIHASPILLEVLSGKKSARLVVEE